MEKGNFLKYRLALNHVIYCFTEGEYKLKEKKDYSQDCDKDDENMNNNCWECIYFCFPIGCMFYERDVEEQLNI